MAKGTREALYSAALGFDSFDELVRQVEEIPGRLSGNLELFSYTETPHDSEGVLYFYAVPHPGTEFQTDLLGNCHAEMHFWSEPSAENNHLLRKAVDSIFRDELADLEELSLSFCQDCTYEMSRFTEAGKLTICPYQTLKGSRNRSPKKPYVPTGLAKLGDFSEPISFDCRRIEDNIFGEQLLSGGELVDLLSSSPVLKVTAGLEWTVFCDDFQEMFQSLASSDEKTAFKFVVTGLIENTEQHFDHYVGQLPKQFYRTVVTQCYADEYDPLAGLGSADLPKQSTIRFPLLHNTVLLMNRDIQIQIDGLLSTNGVYGLELQCDDEKYFNKYKKQIGLSLEDWKGPPLDRWRIL